ncbi:hypothetical protein ACIBHY_49445 [Nonomuraea sp. NPDC050547]|uniref:hypothetical protein n=1 Tax=Nonomuraea sp. NPDC050547 TaxID=3364368 RepID=UPI003787FC42
MARQPLGAAEGRRKAESTADAFVTGPYRPRALRLALGTPPQAELGPALRRLRNAIEAIPP